MRLQEGNFEGNCLPTGDLDLNALWCYEYDFSTSPFDWSLPSNLFWNPSFVNDGEYVSGVGFRGHLKVDGSDTSYDNMCIEITYLEPITVSTIDIFMVRATNADSNSGIEYDFDGSINVVGDQTTIHHQFVFSPSVSIQAFKFGAGAYRTSQSSRGPLNVGETIQKIVFRGPGVNPIGASNCV